MIFCRCSLISLSFSCSSCRLLCTDAVLLSPAMTSSMRQSLASLMRDGDRRQELVQEMITTNNQLRSVCLSVIGSTCLSYVPVMKLFVSAQVTEPCEPLVCIMSSSVKLVVDIYCTRAPTIKMTTLCCECHDRAIPYACIHSNSHQS